MTDFQTEYNRISNLIQEAKEQSAYADSKKITIVNNLLTKRYESIANNPDYEFKAQELKQDFTSYVNSYYQAKYTYLMADASHNKSALNLLIQECLKKYSELLQLDETIQIKVKAETDILLYKKQLNELNTISDEPQSNPVQQMNNVQTKVERDVEAVKPTATTEGHIYPVAMVESWTKELQSYNKQLNGYVEEFNKLNLNKVDRTWLQKQVAKFVTWIKDRVDKLKQKITKAIKGMMKPVNEILDLVKPILSPPSIKTIISWANNIIKYFMAPYQKVITFVKDFAKYTPPLIKESIKLASTATTVPPQIANKVQQLQDQALNVIVDNLNNTTNFESVGSVVSNIETSKYQEAIDNYEETKDEVEDDGQNNTTTT